MIGLGRFQLGDWLPIQMVTYDETRQPVAPTAAPVMTIYDASGTATLSRSIPPMHVGVKTGLFKFEQPLNSDFSAQQYFAHVSWTEGTHDGAELFAFRVVAGGNNKGAYDSLYFYSRPHADFIVGKTDMGTLETRRNPSA